MTDLETAAAAALSSLGHVPASAHWTFDSSVADVFDDMLARSIPQYDVMRRAVFDLGSRYVQRRTAIVDLGASRGEALLPFLKRYGVGNSYVAIEISPPMLDALRGRFKGWECEQFIGGPPIVDIRALDLRRDYPTTPASVTLAVLTLQFVPLEYRSTILRRAYESTIAGGALLVVEKVLSPSRRTHDDFVAIYHASKAAAGYSEDEIARKALALEGVLVPITAAMNEQYLREAGFSSVECFWRWMNFAGWIAVK